MPRRRELTNAADGISGHFIFDSPANPDWPLARIAFAVRAGHGPDYVFDMISGSVAPEVDDLIVLAQFLRGDLDRHLAARKIDPGWVTTATLVLTSDGTTPGTRVPVRCQVALTDDRGTLYTSTRRGSMAIPPLPIGTRITNWFKARLTKLPRGAA